MIDASQNNPTSTPYSKFDSAHQPKILIEEEDSNHQQVPENGVMFAAQFPHDFGKGFLV